MIFEILQVTIEEKTIAYQLFDSFGDKFKMLFTFVLERLFSISRIGRRGCFLACDHRPILECCNSDAIRRRSASKAVNRLEV